MRLAVFDTNVIVSAGIQPGNAPANLVMDWVLEGQIQLVTCFSIVAEYREVTRRSKFRRYGFPLLWLEFLIEESLSLPDPPQWPHSLPDPKDASFLSLAYQAGAWLVTGNRKHFPENICRGVTVASPRQYLQELEDRPLS
jgi:putative PIN family toxin of toxin-antitoxin system